MSGPPGQEPTSRFIIPIARCLSRKMRGPRCRNDESLAACHTDYPDKLSRPPERSCRSSSARRASREGRGTSTKPAKTDYFYVAPPSASSVVAAPHSRRQKIHYGGLFTFASVPCRITQLPPIANRPARRPLHSGSERSRPMPSDAGATADEFCGEKRRRGFCWFFPTTLPLAAVVSDGDARRPSAASSFHELNELPLLPPFSCETVVATGAAAFGRKADTLSSSRNVWRGCHSRHREFVRRAALQVGAVLTGRDCTFSFVHGTAREDRFWARTSPSGGKFKQLRASRDDEPKAPFHRWYCTYDEADSHPSASDGKVLLPFSRDKVHRVNNSIIILLKTISSG